MEPKKSARLPEGVGKKIVEALKNQADPSIDVPNSGRPTYDEIGTLDIKTEEVNPYSENENSYWSPEQETSFETYTPQETPLEEDFNLNFEDEDIYSPISLYEYEEIQPEVYNEPAVDQYNYEEVKPEVQQNYYVPPQDEEESPVYEEYIPPKQETVYQAPKQEPVYQYNPQVIHSKPVNSNQRFIEYTPQEQPSVYKNEKADYEEYMPNTQQKNAYIPPSQNNQPAKPHTSVREEKLASIQNEYVAPEFNISANVETLMQLVDQLPPGVTKQTGAHIIRQTLEAMGISMNKVLSEAQRSQDEISQSTRDNMNTIEEYRNNIKILEKEVQSYKKKSDELEDLISLFILSDKESN